MVWHFDFDQARIALGIFRFGDRGGDAAQWGVFVTIFALPI